MLRAPKYFSINFFWFTSQFVSISDQCEFGEVLSLKLGKRNNSLRCLMHCISNYNCSIMSRAKSRASVDTCGDCGLQGELKFSEFNSILT